MITAVELLGWGLFLVGFVLFVIFLVTAAIASEMAVLHHHPRATVVIFGLTAASFLLAGTGLLVISGFWWPT